MHWRHQTVLSDDRERVEGRNIVSAADPRRSATDEPRGRPSLTPISLLIVLLIFYLIIQVQIIVVLVLFAILFATVIERPVLKLEARGWPRAAGILTVYGVILLGVTAIGIIF